MVISHIKTKPARVNLRNGKHIGRETEALRLKEGLSLLRRADSSVVRVIQRATFVSVYVLNELDQKWSRADIEGPLYIVLRSHEPYHRLVILNQRDPQNLVEDITPFWEVSAEKNYIFFRVPLNPAVEPHPFDPKDRRVAGLWFSDDSERIAVQDAVERILCSVELNEAHTESSTNVNQGSRRLCRNLSARDNFSDAAAVSSAAHCEVLSLDASTGPSSATSENPKNAGEVILNLIGVYRRPSSSQHHPHHFAEGVVDGRKGPSVEKQNSHKAPSSSGVSVWGGVLPALLSGESGETQQDRSNDNDVERTLDNHLSRLSPSSAASRFLDSPKAPENTAAALSFHCQPLSSHPNQLQRSPHDAVESHQPLLVSNVAVKLPRGHLVNGTCLLSDNKTEATVPHGAAASCLLSSTEVQCLAEITPMQCSVCLPCRVSCGCCAGVAGSKPDLTYCPPTCACCPLSARDPYFFLAHHQSSRVALNTHNLDASHDRVALPPAASFNSQVPQHFAHRFLCETTTCSQSICSCGHPSALRHDQPHGGSSFFCPRSGPLVPCAAVHPRPACCGNFSFYHPHFQHRVGCHPLSSCKQPRCCCTHKGPLPSVPDHRQHEEQQDGEQQLPSPSRARLFSAEKRDAVINQFCHSDDVNCSAVNAPLKERSRLIYPHS